jgi:hypothetical protein
VNFLKSLRNNFDELIVPRLSYNARLAYEAKTPPENMTPIEGKRVKYSILQAVYGKLFLPCFVGSLFIDITNTFFT